MRRGLKLSVSNDGLGAAAAVVVADGDGGDKGVGDDVTPGPEGIARPLEPRHIAVRRSLRAARRRWRRLTPVQRLVLVAAAVFVCLSAWRIGGHHGAGGGADLPVASLAAIKEQQKQQKQQQEQQRQKQQPPGPKQQARRQAQAGAGAGAGAAGPNRREAPEAATAGAADPTPPLPPKPAAAGTAKPAANAAKAAVNAGGKQDKKAAAASPLTARKRRKKGRKAAAAPAAAGAAKSTKAKATAKKKAASSTSTSSTTTAKRKAAAPDTAGDADAASAPSSSKAAPPSNGKPAEAAAIVAESKDGEGEAGGKEKSLADVVEDGDALPGAAGDADGQADATGAGAAPEVKAEAEAETEEAEEEKEDEKDAAPADAGVDESGPQQKKLVPGEETELPKLFYCLPNGGFNDICVETWWCIDYARRTGRALVWGYHNYIPQVPPYDPYFTLRPIENVTQYMQAEAAAFLLGERRRRKEQRRFRRILIHPRRLKIDFLLGEDEVAKARKAAGNPLFLNPQGMPQFAFNFSVPHAKADVVVFHKIGNRGSGMDTLRHLRFSDEVKRTFLERWARLSQPYIGLHVRSTDRICPREKIERLLQHTRKLQRSRALKGADVYLATDNPEDSEEFLLELRDKQQRGIKSFTFMPAESEDGERLPLHLNRNLQPAEKHQTNVDGFVDLLLLAFCDHFIKTCGGYGRLANHLHQEKATALSLIGEELKEGQDVNDVLAAAVARMRAESAAGTAGPGRGRPSP